jgi:Glycosyltransferase WbsX
MHLPECPAYRGCLDRVDPSGVAGWVLRTDDLHAPVTIEITLGCGVIAIGRTSAPRVDIERILPRKVACGFEISFLRSDVHLGFVRQAAALLSAGGDWQTRVELGIRVGRHPADKTTWRFELPDGFETTRPLDAWLTMFDVDKETIEREMARRQEKGVSPASPPSGRSPVLPIAFYLPQFHPTPQNDAWWGPGFTEWTNVACHEKIFPSHVAPNLPADLGFYDIRLKEVRQAQAELARSYGVYGFCYYFYWFNGERILEKPLELILRDGAPDMPFCLCWANETWSRRWDGSEEEVLLQQTHDADRDAAIFDDLLPFFEDPRYIRIDGKPLLLIYRINIMPYPTKLVTRLRERAVQAGLFGLYICSVMSFGIEDPCPYGCDAAVGFPPHGSVADELSRSALDVPDDFTGKIYDMRTAVEYAVGQMHAFPHFPGVMARWDNTARRGKAGHLYHYADPKIFEAWMRLAIMRTREMNPSAPFVFINSWNEWGEGAYLEPDRRYGRRYLEALRRAVSGDHAEEMISGEPADSYVDNCPAEGDHYNTRLLVENRLLTKALKRLGLLGRADRAFAGYPPGLATCTHTISRHAYIDGANTPDPRNIVANARTGVWLTGWFWPEDGAAADDGLYFLILWHTETRRSFFLPILERSERPDVAETFEMPQAAKVGFALRFDAATLPGGPYRLELICVKGGNCTHGDLANILFVIDE